METEVLEGGAGRHRVADQGGSRVRENDLTSVRDCRNTSSAVNFETDEADSRLCDFARMNTHADEDSFGGRPQVRDERLLHLNRCGYAGARRGEHGEERVALSVNLLAGVRGEDGPD